MFQFFKFYLSALPFLPVLSEHSLSVSFLALLPATTQVKQQQKTTPSFCGSEN
jgi:hypothetical protein